MAEPGGGTRATGLAGRDAGRGRTATLLDLGVLEAGLRVEGHLPECARGDLDVADCHWCHWALDGGSVRELVDLVVDARSLAADHDDRGGDVSVAWVVAAGDVLDAVDRRRSTGAIAEVVVPSVRALVERLLLVTERAAAPLRRHVRRAVAVDGPVERRCLLGSASMAALALQRPEQRSRRRLLDSRADGLLERVERLLSIDS